MCVRHLLRPAVAATLALAGELLAAGALHAASDIEIRPESRPRKKADEIMVPIPGWSPEVTSNGCHVRRSPEEIPVRQAGRPDVPFWGLIAHAVGRHAVRAILDKPDVFLKKIAALDDDLRRLTLLYALWDGFGRDGLHTFFFLEGGNHAPAIRDALRETGLTREHELFARAMALFGPNYPADREVRAKPFGYSRPGGNLNAFDHALLPLGRAFGSREALARRITDYVNRTPGLFTRIEALREKLGDNDRLRHLTDALSRKIDWSKPDIARRLAALPREERHLIALWVFNAEFENGGIHQFFFNSSGDIAPEVHDAMRELGLVAQEEIFARALAMFGPSYIRDNQKRREAHFGGDWSDWDKKLSALTDDFYAIGGGAEVYRIKGDLAFEGGPGLRHAMLAHAREKKMLPC